MRISKIKLNLFRLVGHSMRTNQMFVFVDSAVSVWYTVCSAYTYMCSIQNDFRTELTEFLNKMNALEHTYIVCKIRATNKTYHGPRLFHYSCMHKFDFICPILLNPCTHVMCGIYIDMRTFATFMICKWDAYSGSGEQTESRHHLCNPLLYPCTLWVIMIHFIIIIQRFEK